MKSLLPLLRPRFDGHRGRRVWTVLVHTFLLMLPAMAWLDAGTPPIAVVVHKDNPLTGLSLEELRRFYLGRTTQLPDGSGVQLLEYSPLAETFYGAVVDMSPLKFRKHWMKLVFAGAHASPPSTYQDLASLRERLCRDKAAIAFVYWSDADTCMKVLAVDGKRPGETSYGL